MRVHLVTVGSTEQHPNGVRFHAATAAEAAAKKKELLAGVPGLKRKDVEVEQIEVPTAKAELLGYINGLIGS